MFIGLAFFSGGIILIETAIDNSLHKTVFKSCIDYLPQTHQMKHFYFLHNPELLPSADCTVSLEHPSDCVHLLKIRTHKILLTITGSYLHK